MADKATVPIYYESRVAKLGLNQSELPKIDEECEAIIPQSRDEELCFPGATGRFLATGNDQSAGDRSSLASVF